MKGANIIVIECIHGSMYVCSMNVGDGYWGWMLGMDVRDGCWGWMLGMDAQVRQMRVEWLLVDV